ncbi:uncharacterized protein LOC131945868 [Physella acuta]|uniref:uncharacterized protein LOC131945868 n=1 Tax=Physella acuta TaxID=109671 RepID=UPI0027DB1A59|nr:uncharacterized protein LOC131945868 [Physella acuta]
MAQASVKPRSTGLDIILIGKSGNGKSSTGNSILRRGNIFKPSYSTSSGTKIPQFEWSKFDDRILQVVDSPGVLDSSEDEAGGITLVHKALQNAVLANPRGYHAFLIVIKFATRFTEDEQKTVKILKGILGETFLKNYGIVLMTNGDTFEFNCRKDKNFNLETFCAVQTGPFKNILEECNNRIVVFNNITQDEEVKHKQLKQLIDTIDQLKNHRRRYTNEHFNKADKFYQHFVATASIPIVTKEFLQEQSLIIHAITSCETLQDGQEKINSLSCLLPRLEALRDGLQEKDRGTGALRDFITNAEDTRRMIETRIKLYTDIMNKLNAIKKKSDKLEQEEIEFNKKNKKSSVAENKIKEILEQKLRLKEEIEGNQKHNVEMLNNSNRQLNEIDEKRKGLHQETNEFFFEKVDFVVSTYGNFIIDTAMSVAEILTNVLTNNMLGDN